MAGRRRCASRIGTIRRRFPIASRTAPDAIYEGIIRRNPIDKPEIVVAGFTGNSVSPQHGGDISRDDIVANVKKIDADLLFFSGDQVYDHRQHYKMWLKWGTDFGEIIKDRPTVSIPDDHDVGQPNLWGAGGKAVDAARGRDGGYAMPVDYVKSVERAQTSHLPDPFDPTPIERGIGVYYTCFTWGRISFAVIEDRKFKTGPAGLIPQQGPRPDHVTDPNYDPQSIDVPAATHVGRTPTEVSRHLGAGLAGCRHESGALPDDLLRRRSHSRRASAAGCMPTWTRTAGHRPVATRPSTRCASALPSIWPAISTWPRSFITASMSFATAATHSVCRRSPTCTCGGGNRSSPEQNREPGSPEYTGDHLDGFHNKVTCYAVANPDERPANGDRLTTRAAGFGVLRFNKQTRKITIECFPRNVDVADPGTQQYPGWPRTIDQQDNYGRAAKSYLPTLVIQGQEGSGDQGHRRKRRPVDLRTADQRHSFSPQGVSGGQLHH